eukprot:gnl/MRDRNA2_/MRDRNA2_101031_c0_seq1.p1 gnl/MRDRNA2_/MRDRNA2_101031_c0~~gnl/MRDRNA2_/MRDRNA2_101031_c0_seq1.p1  ORF type:complete len:309 (+),score=95.15 gnl/MRDRNA2_/MRDRNA2_101031_c0_seq1:139-1065(+)
MRAWCRALLLALMGAVSIAHDLASDVDFQKELIKTQLKDIDQQKIHIQQKLIEHQQKQLIEMLENELQNKLLKQKNEHRATVDDKGTPSNSMLMRKAVSSLVQLSDVDVPDDVDVVMNDNVSRSTDDSLSAMMGKLHAQETADAADAQVTEMMKKAEEKSKNAASSEKLSMALGALDIDKEGSSSSDDAIEKTLSQLQRESKDSKSLDEELAKLEQIQKDTALKPAVFKEDELASHKDPNDRFSSAQSLLAISDDSGGASASKQRAGRSWDKWYDSMHQRLNALDVDKAIEELGVAVKSASAGIEPTP